MRTLFARSRSRRCLLLAIAVLTLRPDERAWAQDQQQVLVLYSTRRDAQIVVVGDRELQRILGQGLPGGIDYYSEDLDDSRFGLPEYEKAFRDSLGLKYERQRFDL